MINSVQLLRVDFSSQIGLGHLRRIETFVQRYNLTNPIIVCKECDANLTTLPLVRIDNEVAFFEYVQRLKPSWVIVDNYKFTYENEREFKRLFPHIKLTVFDDTYAKHYADEIINHNLGAQKEKYENPDVVRIIPPLIRKEFKKAKRKKYKKEGIFLSLGGSDAKNLTLRVLKILKPLKIQVNIYTTSANQNLDRIQKYGFTNKWVRLHINEDVAEGMAKSLFAIITPSVISYEAIYMGLDFIAIQTAENQKELVKFLKRKYKVIKDHEINKISRLVLKRKN